MRSTKVLCLYEPVLAEDELIVNYNRTRASNARALAIDANNDLWVGGLVGWHSQNVYGRISGTTGLADMTTAGPNPGIRNIGGGYGAVIDGNNVLWSVDRPIQVARHDLTANTTTNIPALGCFGIGVGSCDNSIWVSSFKPSNDTGFNPSLSNTFVLRHFNNAGVLIGACAQPDVAQGLSVDSDGEVFVSKHSLPSLVSHAIVNMSKTCQCGIDLSKCIIHNGEYFRLFKPSYWQPRAKGAGENS
jgi:hypothetical protein